MPKTRSGNLIQRFGRAVRRYGWRGTFRFLIWIALSYPRINGRPLWGRAAVNGLARLFELLGVRQIRARVNGVPLYVDPRDYWAVRAYLLYPVYDREEIEAVRRTVPADYLFVDVGANFGAWSVSLSNHFFRIIAVEPEPRCWGCLQRTVAEWELENIAVFPVALSEEDGRGELFPSRSFLSDSRIYHPGDAGRMDSVPVSLRSMDSIFRELSMQTEDLPGLFLKLDVQGVEPRVLRGMETTLHSVRDLVLWTEMTEPTLAAAGFSLEGYVELLLQLGFSPVNLFEGLAPMDVTQLRASLKGSKDACWRRRQPIAEGISGPSPEHDEAQFAHRL